MHMTQGLHRAMQQHADRVAIRFGVHTRTYAQFVERVSALAGALQGLGMGPDTRVAMVSLNSDRYLEYQMAVPWGDGVLNPCNVRWSASEIAYSINDSGSTILLVDDAHTHLIEPLGQACPGLRAIIHCGDGEAPSGTYGYESLVSVTRPVPDAMRGGSKLAAILYTGGTTGLPKGVMLSHANFCSSALAIISEGLVPQGSTYLHATPMFHVADIGSALPHWMIGNTHSVIPAFSPEAAVEAVETHRVTHSLLVPTMIQRLLDHPVMSRSPDLRSLRTLVYGASPISEAILERAMSALSGVDFVQFYGMTELILATVNPAWTHSVEGRRRGKLRAAGRSTLNMEVRVVDPTGREVSRGTVGEIVVRGPSVMQGYWNKPDQTAAALRDGWMHTGDGAFMDDDGFFFVVDRIKDMIISGGENVYSAEVENTIAQHPAIAACAVIGIPSEKWGEAVHAAVVLKPGMDVTATELIAHTKALIAGYKCPRSVEFRDALPISAAGKILKAELRKPFWDGCRQQVA